MKTLAEKMSEFPDIIEHYNTVIKPNVPINVHLGKLTLESKTDKKVITIRGKITFYWTPIYGCRIEGTINKHDYNKFIFNPLDSYDVKVNNNSIGFAFIQTTINNFESTRIKLIAVFEHRVLLGKIEQKVDKITFAIPNLISISGEIVKKIISTKIYNSNFRISLNYKNWEILMDKNIDYEKAKKTLLIKGGYNILYQAELTLKQGETFIYDEGKVILDCFDLFISYINGRKTSSLLLNGYIQKSMIWSDYSPKSVDPFKEVKSSFYYRNIKSLQNKWEAFNKIWESDSGKEFLKTVIHWYLQANNNAGLLEGSIIMAQAGLEKIYHWIFKLESKATNSAPQKLRDLIKYLALDENEVHLRHPNIKKYYENIENKKHRDIAGVITSVRNDLIHPKESFITSIDTKREVLQISLWLIEMTLLHLLCHEGKYFDRMQGKYIIYK